MKFIEVILLIVMCGLFIFSFSILLDNFPRQSVDYDSYIANVTVDAKSASVAQFYPNMRYSDKEITYSIDEACSDRKKFHIYNALKILENETILRFTEIEEGEIKYLCAETVQESEYNNHYVAGEGGPTGIINTTLFSVILSGQVSLYREDKCDKPQIALHETLHALGFDHVNNEGDIMYPITSCNQEMKPDMIRAINYIYDIRNAPDLGIEYVKANQTGKFLNFYITIVNYGLEDSDGASLEIFAQGEPLREFELGKIRMGTKKFLNVQNMKLDESQIDVVKFVLNLDQDDLYEDNNFAEIYLKYE